MKFEILGAIIGVALAFSLIFSLGILGVLSEVGDFWTFVIGFGAGGFFTFAGQMVGSTFDEDH